MIFPEIALVLSSYVMGSIPFGYLFTKKSTGLNVFEFGSGNIGSTNVKRIAGKKIALYTQLCDMLKGFVPVLIVQIINHYQVFILSEYAIFMVALAAILGHNFSMFLKFKGGKGVNTTLGASVLIAPVSVFVSVALYYLVKWKSHYVSLGSIALAVSLPLTYLLFYTVSNTFYYLLAVALFILLRHQANIKRLILGMENK